MKNVSCGGILWKTTCAILDLPERRDPISSIRGEASDIWCKYQRQGEKEKASKVKQKVRKRIPRVSGIRTPNCAGGKGKGCGIVTVLVPRYLQAHHHSHHRHLKMAPWFGTTFCCVPHSPVSRAGKSGPLLGKIFNRGRKSLIFIRPEGKQTFFSGRSTVGEKNKNSSTLFGIGALVCMGFLYNTPHGSSSQLQRLELLP